MLAHHLKILTKFYWFCLLVLITACDSETVIIDTNENQNIPEQKKEAQPLQLKSKEDTKKHTLWKIQGERNTVYLLGSIHLLSPELYPLPDVYEKAYIDAEKLVFEIDESILDPQLAQSAVMKFAPLPAGQTLEEVIGEQDYAEIKALAKKNKVPMFVIEPYDPWFSGLTLVSMQYLNAGFSPEFGIDQHYMQRALQSGKPVQGLETMEEQFAMFDSISIDIQTDMLIETLKKEVNIKEFIGKMIAEWQEGDLSALQELLQEDFEKYEEMYEVLLINRNKNWIPQLLPMLNDQDDYLVVVGAAHMLGEEGIVRLLELEGYTVEQL